MRGKTIVSIYLIALMLGIPLIASVMAAPQGTPKISVDPDFVTGHPEGADSSFTISIKIDNVNNLYGWGVDLRIEPLERIITATAYTEGAFLKAAGTTWFVTPIYNKITGTISLGATLLGPNPGVSGDGTLVTIDMIVLEAGETPIELLNTKLLDNTGSLIPHNAWDGYYEGPTMNLVNKELSSHDPSASASRLEFMSTVRNLGDVPLLARTKFEIVTEEGMIYNLYAGQTFATEAPPPVYLYVDSFTDYYGGWGWTEEGTGAYLNAIGDSNYIWADYDSSTELIPENTGSPIGFPILGKWDFADLPSGYLDDKVVSRVTMEAYMQYEDGYYDCMDIDTYCRNPPANVPPTSWIGSLWATDTYDWYTVRWTADALFPDLFSGLATEVGINEFETRYVMYWTCSGFGHGRVNIDAMRIKIEFSPVAPLDGPWIVIEPNSGNVAMPTLNWDLLPADVGRYRGTTYVEYRYFPLPPPGAALTAARGRKVSTFKFRVQP